MGRRFTTSPHNLPFKNRTIAEIDADLSRASIPAVEDTARGDDQERGQHAKPNAASRGKNHG